MVRTCKAGSIRLPRWCPDPVVFDEPDRETAVRKLLRIFKTIPTEQTPQFLQAVAEACETGRCGPEAAAETWMTWDQVREMKRDGMVIGGHTLNHPILARLPYDGQWEEISGCLARIEQELGEPARHFSYPVGGPDAFDENSRRCMEKSGIRYAFSYYGGYHSAFDGWDCHDMPRMAVGNETRPAQVRAMVQMPQFFCQPSKSFKARVYRKMAGTILE
jgi:hypothetical protein